MNVNEALRMIAGTMILISLYLASTYSTNWLWFTAFIGVNLLQSAFTKWCLMMSILRKIGIKE
ncbi:YgaP family membrane protein [Thalassotalea ganghwensis]